MAHPVRLAALTALLVTGTDPEALRTTTVMAVDERCTRLTVPDVWHPAYGTPTPPPGVGYAIPPRARPILRTALAFRRLEQAQDHFLLFTASFGHQLPDLVRDGAMHIPALHHQHAGPDWHHQARYRRLAVTTLPIL
ncbi:hypothetical protein [Streptomyces sp. NPDC001530]|uniref:hypothetical protein n=1 Tax=Streptomyces sp. NPDC001530 TaxID=3364582 RepID=UPI0036A93F80